MKTVAYCILHYGEEWLRHAILSVKDYVDDVVIVYTPHPSHGSTTSFSNPDSATKLNETAKALGANWYRAPSKFRWEGDHRQYAVERCMREHGAQRIIVFDHDEVWEPALLEHVLEVTEQSGAGTFRVPFRHFYRSVKWVCEDAAMPTRVLIPRNDGKIEEYISHGHGVVNHFGYAQREEIIRYKWKIHGHINELRPNWLEDKFVNFKPGQTLDVHPTNKDYWTPAAFDHNKISNLVGDHEYFNLEIIP